MGIFQRFDAWLWGAPTVNSRSEQTAIQAPWAPTDALVTFALDEALHGAIVEAGLTVTRDVALRIPPVKRAHDIICGLFAGITFEQRTGADVDADQPAWLYTSDSGISPYHTKWGLASDMFMNGWACQSFNADFTDSIHVPFGWWGIHKDTRQCVILDDVPVPAEFRANPRAVWLGYGSNGMLVDGIEAVLQSRAVTAAYDTRLDNPVALTILNIEGDRYDAMTKTSRRALRQEWNEGRRESATAVVPSYVSVDTNSAGTETSLYESARNAVRLDIANHAGVPASLVEGSKQAGGGGVDIKYSGVGEGGGVRNELYDFGVAKYVRAYEARMSLDDVSPTGKSVRGDLRDFFAAPNPTVNTPSED